MSYESYNTAIYYKRNYNGLAAKITVHMKELNLSKKNCRFKLSLVL